MKPLKSSDSNKGLIDAALVDEIFYTIPEILQHHENFLSALQSRLSSDWDSSQVIGNLFIEAVSRRRRRRRPNHARAGGQLIIEPIIVAKSFSPPPPPDGLVCSSRASKSLTHTRPS